MLEKLRAKSESAKKSISLVFTIIIFSGIFFVWLTSWDARSKDEVTREKTVAPLGGLGAMIDGFVLDVKDAMSGTPSFVKPGDKQRAATSTNNFDLSGVVVLDESTTTESQPKR